MATPAQAGRGEGVPERLYAALRAVREAQLAVIPTLPLPGDYRHPEDYRAAVAAHFGHVEALQRVVEGLLARADEVRSGAPQLVSLNNAARDEERA